MVFELFATELAETKRHVPARQIFADVGAFNEID
jgi:hypothetical protein